MRNCQPGAYYAGAGRRVAEADLRHISVSDLPTTDIRETCTCLCVCVSGAGENVCGHHHDERHPPGADDGDAGGAADQEGAGRTGRGWRLRRSVARCRRKSSDSRPPPLGTGTN